MNGDSGNDSELFEAPDVYGCIVGNAMAELNEWADAHPGERIFRCAPPLHGPARQLHLRACLWCQCQCRLL